MAISEEVLNEIKYKNDIETVVSSYVSLKRAGKNLSGLCPFHNEKTPSFTVYTETASFYCFGCGLGGDVFTFVKLIENLDYIEAVKLLADRSGVTVEESNYNNAVQNLKRRIYEINREAARFFHNYLLSPKGKWALDYLLGRGLTLATIKHFGLGCAPDGWSELTDYLLKKGYTVDEIIQADISVRSSKNTVYDRFRHRVMFPVINIRGNVIAFSGRKDPKNEDDKRKYVNTSDTLVYKKSENLFGMNFAKNFCADRVILVEGNMDVISLHQAGFENTVASLGTSFTVEAAKLLSRYTKEIIICYDADSAGQKATSRAIELLRNSGIIVRIINIPDGKDPDEYLKNNSSDKFRMLLDGAVNDIEYKLNQAAKGVNNDDLAGITDFLKKAAEILAETNDKIAVDLYVGNLCNRFNIQRSTLEDTIGKIRAKKYQNKLKTTAENVIRPKIQRNAVNPEKQKNLRAANAEEIIISIILQHPDFYDTFRNELSSEIFVTSLNREIYKIMDKNLSDGKVVDVLQFGDTFTPEQLGYIVSLQNGIKGEQEPKKVLLDAIKVLQLEHFNKQNSDTKAMSDDEWVEYMSNIVNNKKEN